MIIIKSKREIDLMREAAKVTGEILREMPRHIAPGVSTAELNDFVEETIKKYKMQPTFKGYGGFPAGACISINEEVVHGIPSKDRILKEGDIVSVDTGATYKGYCSDAARTYPVGEISKEAENLIKVTKNSFFEGVKYAMAGYRLHDIGYHIEAYATKNNISVIRDYLGHGIGRNLHEDPQVPNYGEAGTGVRLEAGMVLAIEPMLALGTYECVTLKNGWTVITGDGKLSAHYENTVVINEGEPELLTI